MMKNIKDITISIFTVIGFVSIITAYTNQPEQSNQTTTPESHVWQGILTEASSSSEGRFYLYYNVTGEVRKFNRIYPSYKYQSWRDSGKDFIIMKNVEDVPLKEK